MGNSNSSAPKVLEYGTIKTTGAKLYELGVIVLEQGQIELGK
jgi:hypothetical protein